MTAAEGETSARFALVAVAVLWGVNYIATDLGLRAFSPWFFRTLIFLAGAGLLILGARLVGVGLGVGSVRQRWHLAVSGCLACGGFGVLSALALLQTSTGRAAICTSPQGSKVAHKVFPFCPAKVFQG